MMVAKLIYGKQIIVEPGKYMRDTNYTHIYIYIYIFTYSYIYISRGSYCALSVAALTNLLTPELMENCADFIAR